MRREMLKSLTVNGQKKNQEFVMRLSESFRVFSSVCPPVHPSVFPSVHLFVLLLTGVLLVLYVSKELKFQFCSLLDISTDFPDTRRFKSNFQ